MQSVLSQEFHKSTFSSSVTHCVEAACVSTVQSVAVKLPRDLGSSENTQPVSSSLHCSPAYFHFQEVKRDLMSPPVSYVILAEMLALSAMGIHLFNKLPKESREIRSTFTVIKP